MESKMEITLEERNALIDKMIKKYGYSEALQQLKNQRI